MISLSTDVGSVVASGRCLGSLQVTELSLINWRMGEPDGIQILGMNKVGSISCDEKV